LHHSLRAYVTGLGVYLGFVWQDKLDTDTSPDDRRNIFIFFIVSLTVCYAIYWILDIANRCKDSPWEHYFHEVRKNPNVGVRKLQVRPETRCQVSSDDCSKGCWQSNSLKGIAIRKRRVPLRHNRRTLAPLQRKSENHTGTNRDC
jgi:hypothetical protein